MKKKRRKGDKWDDKEAKIEVKDTHEGREGKTGKDRKAERRK